MTIKSIEVYGWIQEMVTPFLFKDFGRALNVELIYQMFSSNVSRYLQKILSDK